MVLSLVKLELLQRIRSLGFWISLLLFALVIANAFPESGSNYLSVVALAASLEQPRNLGILFRGSYSSAWIGMSIAYLTAVFVSTIGFFAIRGNITKDKDTQVWQVLLTSRMSRFHYLIAKWLSHVCILSLFYVVGVLVGVIIQLIRAEDTNLITGAFITPYFKVVLPMMVVVALIAIVMELIPELRRTAGSIAYLGIWILFFGQLPKWLVAAEASNWILVLFDLHGYDSMQAAVLNSVTQPFEVARLKLDNVNVIIGGFMPLESAHFAFMQLPFSLSSDLIKLIWIPVALAVLWVCSLYVDQSLKRESKRSLAFDEKRGAGLHFITKLCAPLQGSKLGILFTSEIQLILRMRPIWWWGGLSICFALQVFPDLHGVPPVPSIPLMATAGAWVMCMDIFSRGLLRDLETKTLTIVLASSINQNQLLLVKLMTSLFFALLVTMPMMIRGALLGEGELCFNLLLVSLLLVTYGILTALLFRNAKVFELLLCLTFYAFTKGFDFLNVMTMSEQRQIQYTIATLLATLTIPILWNRWRSTP